MVVARGRSSAARSPLRNPSCAACALVRVADKRERAKANVVRVPAAARAYLSQDCGLRDVHLAIAYSPVEPGEDATAGSSPTSNKPDLKPSSPPLRCARGCSR